MRRTTRAFSITVCCLSACALAGAVTPAPAAAHTSARIAVHGKFRAMLTQGGDFTCAAGRVPMTVRAVGAMSRLGTATTLEEHCLDPVSGQDDALVVLTFGNGDTLSQHDVVTVQPGSTPAATRIRGTWQIQGGTGRFAGATGNGRIRGVVDQVTGAALVRTHGHLSGVGG